MPGLSFAGGQGCPITGLVPCGTPGCPCSLCDFFVMLNRIVIFFLIPDANINQGVPLIIVLAVLMVAIGGFMMLFAYASEGGGPQMLNKARSLFKAVVIGLLIAYGAWLIIDLFLQILGVTVWVGPGNGWWKISGC